MDNIEYSDGPLGKEQKLSESEEYALKKVTDLFKEAKDGRELVSERMRKNELLYLNQPPKNNNTTADVKHALAHSAVETLMPVIGDYFPIISVHGKTSNDYLFQDYVQQRINALIEESRLDEKALMQAKDALIYRNGYLRIVPIFDFVDDAPDNVEELSEEEKMQYKTLSGLDVSTIDPMAVFPDPYGRGLDIGENCRYFIIAEVMPKETIASMYDMDVDEIPEDAFEWQDYVSNVQDKYGLIEGLSKADFAIMKTCYWRSGKDYKYGRKTVVVGNILLEDIKLEIPYTPYFLLKNFSSDRRFYGIGEPELVAASTFAINSLISHMIDNVTTYGKAKKVVTPNVMQRIQTQVDDNEYIVADDPTQFSYKSIDPVPPSIFNLLDVELGLHEKSNGISDVLEGKRPAGITSARGIEALRETSMARARFKIKHDIAPMMKQVGKYITYLITKYDIAGSEVRVEKTDGSGEKYVWLNPKAIFSKETKQLLSEDELKTVDDKKKIALSDTNMDITVETGRGYEKGSIARELQAAEKFDRGEIPFSWYVAEMQTANKQELVKWWEQKNQVLQLIMQLKGVADSMKKDGIRSARDWAQSKELETLTQIIMNLQNIEIETLTQARF